MRRTNKPQSVTDFENSNKTLKHDAFIALCDVDDGKLSTAEANIIVDNYNEKLQAYCGETSVKAFYLVRAK